MILSFVSASGITNFLVTSLLKKNYSPTIHTFANHSSSTNNAMQPSKILDECRIEKIELIKRHNLLVPKSTANLVLISQIKSRL